MTRRPEFERRIRLFIDKGWNYGEPEPDHYFLAPNLRMTELQGAVALAQLDKVENVVRARQESAQRLTDQIASVPGIQVPAVTGHSTHVYWRYPLMVDPEVIRGGADGLGRQLKERGISCAPHYIQKPAFMCRIFRERQTFGNSGFPLPAETTYRMEDYPGTARALSQICLLPWNEKFTRDDVEFIAESILESVAGLS